MSTVAVTPARDAVVKRSRLGYALADTAVMTKRHLLQALRIPDLWAGSTIQPIMFVLLFRYVFGGAINTGALSYVNFLMPGIFVQTVIFGSMATGIGLADDMHKGVVDRFRSLPMAPAAVLTGRTVADLLRNSITVVVMLTVGVLVGFRPEGNPLHWLLAIVIGMMFAYVMSWVAALIGLYCRTVEATQQIGFTAIFPLTFASSAFAPVESMPGWLQAFAAHQPVTVVIDALRGLMLDRPIGNAGWLSVVWSAGILVVVVPLAVRKYRSATTR